MRDAAGPGRHGGARQRAQRPESRLPRSFEGRGKDRRDCGRYSWTSSAGRLRLRARLKSRKSLSTDPLLSRMQAGETYGLDDLVEITGMTASKLLPRLMELQLLGQVEAPARRTISQRSRPGSGNVGQSYGKGIGRGGIAGKGENHQQISGQELQGDRLHGARPRPAEEQARRRRGGWLRAVLRGDREPQEGAQGTEGRRQGGRRDLHRNRP